MKKHFLEIQKQVFARRPVLKEIAANFSGHSLKDNAQKFWQLPGQPADEIFLRVLQEEMASIYGGKVAKDTIGQLKTRSLVSTIDHHGLWGHPIFVNSDLIYSLHFRKDDLPLILATESVSLNNTSSWSASLLYYHNGKLERHSFLPDHQKTLPVFSAPAISAKDIYRFQRATQGRFDGAIEILNLAKLSPVNNFSTQACPASSRLWQAVFPSAPKLIYLPLETLISKYLLQIFKDPKHILSQIVLGQKGRQLWSKYFADERTFMFWAIDNKGRRRLMNYLPNKERLIEQLLKRKIYPASPLCFIVLLKAGLACAGGFTQTTWLSEVKEKFVKLLSEMGADEFQAAGISSIPTKNFAESSLAWLSYQGKYITPTAVDLFSTGKDYYSKYLESAEKITLGQSLKLAMPIIYSVVVPKSEQFTGFDLEKCQQEIFYELDMKKILADVGI